MGLVNVFAKELDADLDDGVLDVINESQVGTLQSLMPSGAAWPQDGGGQLVSLERALSYEFSRVKRRSNDFVNELYPNTCYELLPDYERI